MIASTIEAQITTVGTSPQVLFLDQVMRQCEAAILAGSASTIDAAALGALLAKLKPEVEKQLIGPDLLTQQQKWWDDSKNVLLAATTLGTIATCIARLNHQPTVDNDALSKAFDLVKKECGGRFGPEGCYCGCPDIP
jgi:hypothetical protein